MRKENVSTVFLLPGIEIKNELKNMFYTFGFENTFLTCKPLEYPWPVLYILFKPSVIDLEFTRFADELQKNPNFIEVIDAGRNKVLFVYRVPNRFKKDYQLFIDGKYSKLSEEYRKCFVMEQPRIDPITNKPIKDGGRYVMEYTDFYHIFHRTDHIKAVWAERLGYDDDEILDDMEMYDRQDVTKETMEEELWLG